MVLALKSYTTSTTVPKSTKGQPLQLPKQTVGYNYLKDLHCYTKQEFSVFTPHTSVPIKIWLNDYFAELDKVY